MYFVDAQLARRASPWAWPSVVGVGPRLGVAVVVGAGPVSNGFVGLQMTHNCPKTVNNYQLTNIHLLIKLTITPPHF